MRSLYLRKQWQCLLVVSIIVMLVAVALPQAYLVHAANTITVDETGDTQNVNGACSLREAVLAANNNDTSGGNCESGSGVDTDTIVLANDTIYTLALSAAPDNDSTDGDLDIVDDAVALDVIITTADPNGDPATIDAGTIGERVLQILSGANVRLENVIITGGESTLNGGGIYNNGTLELNGVTVTGNEVTAANFEGGGIYNLGSLTLDGSSVTANRVAGSGGGGISNRGGSLTIENNSSINNNGVQGNGNGAGLLNIGGTVTMSDAALDGNDITGDGDGAGIYNGPDGSDVALLTLNTVSIINSEITGAGSGAGLYNDGGRVIGTAVTISTNKSTDGGGGGIYTQSNTVGNGIVDLTDATITSNTASNDGGAIRNEGSSVSLTDSFFTTNTSDSDGGGIFSVGAGDADAQVTLDNTGFTVNTASTGNGGALYNGLGSTATLLNGTVLSEGNNAGANGGGIYNHLGGTVTLDNSAVLGNAAQNSGGGIYNMATMTIENSSSIGSGSNGNFTTDGEGGGIFNQGTLTIRDSSVAGNRTSPGAGTADASGGGIFNQGLIVGQGLLTLDNVLVQSNSTGDGDNSVGGGIASTGVNATMTISGSVINDNSTGSGLGSAGGGIYNDASLELQGSTLSGNSTGDGADAHGGALITTPDGTATLLNTTISGNQTGTGDPSTGGAIYAAGDMTLLFSTIAENAAGTDAGGIFVSADTAVILRGVILAGNMVAGQPNNCADPNGGMVSAGSNLLGEHNGCTTAFNDGDNGDIVGTPDAPIDPLLGPLTDNGGPTPTHALLDASPAINAALPDMCVALDLSPIATDQRRESRPFGPTCDIGAFERGPVAPTDVTISGPTEGVVDATHTFSATVGIANTTLPITYTWTAEDQESVQQTNVDALTTTVGFVWDTPGTRSITVTADNGAGMVTSMVWLFNVLESDTTDPTPGDENLLTGVQISGPPSGVVGLDQVFNATVTPITITTPITYTWEAGGQAPVVETGGGISATPQAFSWDTPGTRAVTVTADNGSGAPVVDTAQIEIVEASITETLITAISLNGPTTGDTGQSYAFTAQVTPADATVPITYTWTTSDEQEQVQTGGGTSAQTTFSWDSAGTYTVTVTADNSIGDPVSTSRGIEISATSQPGDSDTRLYLPLIAR